MSNLTNVEKRQFERLLQMGGGYVLNFSNRTFAEFVTDSIGREIYDARYSYGSGSKANQLRGFWKEEANRLVGKLMGDMLDYGAEIGAIQADQPDLNECRRTVSRLVQDSRAGRVEEERAVACRAGGAECDPERCRSGSR